MNNNEVFEINDEEERVIDEAPAQDSCDEDDDDGECYFLFFRKRPGYLQVLCCWCAEASRKYPLLMSHVHSQDPYECGVCERVISPYQEDPLYGTLHKPFLYPWGFHELEDWRDVGRPMMENDRPEDSGELEVEENPWPEV